MRDEMLDRWRVETHQANRRVKLSAEMKVPGRAGLEFEVERSDKGSIIRQTAVFDPVGFFGLVYWYGIYSLHAVIFRGMLNRIPVEAEMQ